GDGCGHRRSVAGSDEQRATPPGELPTACGSRRAQARTPVCDIHPVYVDPARGSRVSQSTMAVHDEVDGPQGRARELAHRAAARECAGAGPVPGEPERRSYTAQLPVVLRGRCGRPDAPLDHLRGMVSWVPGVPGPAA